MEAQFKESQQGARGAGLVTNNRPRWYANSETGYIVHRVVIRTHLRLASRGKYCAKNRAEETASKLFGHGVASVLWRPVGAALRVALRRGPAVGAHFGDNAFGGPRGPSGAALGRGPQGSGASLARTVAPARLANCTPRPAHPLLTRLLGPNLTSLPGRF
jgi:hypothetical protein